MSIIGSNILAGASGQGVGGYTIETSLRFRASASAYLSWTPASAGSGTTVTFSAWVKRGYITSTGSFQQVFGSHTGTNAFDMFGFDAYDRLVFRIRNSSAVDLVRVESASVYRDPSAWYHIVGVYDSTNATSTERVRLYVNGERITAFDTATYPSSGQVFTGNFLTNMQIGRGNTNSSNMYYFDGYLTEVNFIDGQALDPTSFGEYNADTGVWQPTRYAGTYGTNGFYLPFSDATTTTTLSADSSGNGNDWTTHNISLTAGVTYDSMTDTPTPYVDGGNYCTWNPLAKSPNQTVTNANLKAVNSSGGYQSILGTMGVSSGKWYFEVTELTSAVGIAETTIDLRSTNEFIPLNQAAWVYSSNGNKVSTGVNVAYGASFTSTDIIGVAFDADAGTLTFYKNGTSQGVAFTGLTGATYAPYAILLNTQPNATANFGQRPFAYTPPTGFLPLHTGNLPDSSIVDGSKYFDVVTYAGTGATTHAITSLDFPPSLVWIKARDIAQDHTIYDQVRGVRAQLESNLTAAEVVESAGNGLVSFDSNGFTLDGDTYTYGGINSSGYNYVAWNWKANGTGVSNTAGSIESTVSANQAAGFSVVTYTGNGSAGATVGHGLGVAPKVIIVKERVGSGSWDSWQVYHASLTNPQTSFLRLNETAGAYTGFTAAWNSTNPTNSVFSISYNAGAGVNGSGDTFVAYCFAEVESYSKFGSYLGNNLSDGVFVYLGFRPRFLMIKSTSANTEWVMIDTERSSYNLSDTSLYANRAYSEATITAVNDVDILSNGFKLRNNTGYVNASQTYIYMAFAEVPFSKALAR